MGDLAFVLRFPALCTEGVTRRDEFQPCDKPAVAVRIDPESGLYPVCARHARGEMVLLVVLIAAVRAQVASEILGERIVCPVHGIPDCSALLNGCSRPSLLDGYRTGIANRIAGGLR